MHYRANLLIIYRIKRAEDLVTHVWIKSYNPGHRNALDGVRKGYYTDYKFNFSQKGYKTDAKELF